MLLANFLFNNLAKFCENFGKIWTKPSVHTVILPQLEDAPDFFYSAGQTGLRSSGAEKVENVRENRFQFLVVARREKM